MSIKEAIGVFESGKAPKPMYPSPIKYLYLTGIVVEVIVVEAMVNGLDERFNLSVPKRMPRSKNSTEKKDASLLFRLEFLIKIAKGNLKYLKYNMIFPRKSGHNEELVLG